LARYPSFLDDHGRQTKAEEAMTEIEKRRQGYRPFSQ